MAQDRYPVAPAFAAAARIDATTYARDYPRSVGDPDGFWAEVAQRLDWLKAPTRIDESSFALDDFRIRWFADGELNVAANCLDRHLAVRGDKTAIVFEPDDPGQPAQRISYR